jgi:XTP/dITP diphosphohydrolase
MEKLFFVTGRDEKVREAEAILQTDVEQIKLDVPEIQSTDVVEVVREKAKAAARLSGRTVVVDDTGIHIDALNGFPGALSKPFLDSLHNKGILRVLRDEKDRRAVVRTAVGLCSPGSEPLVFVGEVEGSIALEERGTGNFGFDPIFVPKGSQKTYAEMTLREKNEISHRRRALDKLKHHLSLSKG